MNRKILIADDEQDILEIISFNLLAEGYQVFTASNGAEAVKVATKEKPDLIILDVMMPVKDGVAAAQQLRTMPEFTDTVIVFLTALNDDSSAIQGLSAGADDYIHKPISPKMLSTKVQSLLRRIDKPASQEIEVGELKIDKEKFGAVYKGQELQLAKKEFELLALLASRPGKVFLRNEILSQIWGTDVIVGDRTIDVHIRKIRQKMGDDCITTVKGVGYKYDEQAKAGVA